MPTLLVLSQTHNLWGGIESWMADVLPAAQNAGWEIEFALSLGKAFNRPDSFLREHPYIRAWHALDGRVGTPAARQRAIRRSLVRADADVLLPLAVGDALPALRIERSRGLRTRWLAAIHSNHLGTLADLRENHDLLDGAGFVSGLLCEWGRRHLGLEESRLRHLRNGSNASASCDPKRPSQRLQVAYVGRLENTIKRVRDLPAIHESASGAGVAIDLTVVGEGPEREGLEQRFAAMRDPTNVRFLGKRDRSEVELEILPRTDVLLLTSETEGSPLTVIEAMRSGAIPVVSRFLGHAAEGLLKPEENCLTFAIGDTQSAARQLQRLAADEPLRKRLSGAARRSAEPYSRSAMIGGWLDLLQAVLDLEPRQPTSRGGGKMPAFGRLERWGVPASVAERLRSLARRHFPHRSGFDEWPGSLSTDSAGQERIVEELASIEREFADRIYDENHS